MQEEEEEEPKIYINNRTNSWAVVGRVGGGGVTVLTKEEPSVESKVIPDWVKEAMKEEEKEEEGEEEETSQKPPREVKVPQQMSQRNDILGRVQGLVGGSFANKLLG